MSRGFVARGQISEVLVYPHAGGPALLRVELGSHQVAPSVDATKFHAVLGGADLAIVVGGDSIVAVDEIEVAVLRNAVKHGMGGA